MNSPAHIFPSNKNVRQIAFSPWNRSSHEITQCIWPNDIHQKKFIKFFVHLKFRRIGIFFDEFQNDTSGTLIILGWSSDYYFVTLWLTPDDLDDGNYICIWNRNNEFKIIFSSFRKSTNIIKMEIRTSFEFCWRLHFEH